MNMYINEYCFYPNSKLIGENIKKLRKAKKITASKMAELLFYETKSINKWEQGRGLPSVEQLIPICKILNVSIDDILYPKAKFIYDYSIDPQEYQAGYILPYDCLYTFSTDFLDNKEILLSIYDLCYLKIDYLLQKYVSSWLNQQDKEEFRYFFKETIGYSNYLLEQCLKLNTKEEEYISEYFVNKFGIGYKTYELNMNELLFEINKFICKKVKFNKYDGDIYKSIISQFVELKDNDDFICQLNYMIHYLNLVEKDVLYTTLIKSGSKEFDLLLKILKDNDAKYLMFSDELEFYNNNFEDYIKKINYFIVALSYFDYLKNRRSV